MFEKLFGKKDDKPSEKASRPGKAEPLPETAVRPPSATPPSSAPPPSRSNLTAPSVLRAAEGAAEAEERARAAMAAIAAAATPAAAPVLELPHDAGAREQAAALFAMGEHKRAIDVLVGHLNTTSGNAPKNIWFMLMDAYQALGQQAAFEKSAWLFADFFKTSPPSWEGTVAALPSNGAMGRSVLILDGLPSQVHAEKIKDFLAAARQAGVAKLDLSRTRLDEDHAQRSDDLKTLLSLMRRLRRYGVQVLLMGENQVVEVLRAVIQRDLPVFGADLYWELLLEFMQWRGQEDAFEDLAIAFATRFGRSAPGYEPSGVIAQAPTEAVAAAPASEERSPPEVLDDPAMETWCQRLEGHLPVGDTVERLDFRHVKSVAFTAAGAFATRLRRWGLPASSMVIAQPSELVLALFDITGVSGQVSVEPRRR